MSSSQESITNHDHSNDETQHAKLLCCFLAVFAIAMAVRLVNLNQPLVDGFIDRQVHTAMMARNIARGESILYPQIDIGPFPSYYMLEFPGYAALAGITSQYTGLPLDIVGRSLSAFCIALACLFLMDLVRRREGLPTACGAAMAMALMPVTIRYGRAFQPDSMMLCCLIAAVWCADRWAQGGKAFVLITAGILTGYALLLKVISAYILVPLFYLVWKRCGWSFWRSPTVWTALLIAAVPSVWWYFHAYEVASGAESVSTPFWKLHKWFAPDRLVQESTYRQLAYFIGLRVLTPVGLILAAVGFAVRSKSRLFHIWSLGLLTYIPILARKVDHEHYYFALVPVTAVFIARALVVLYQADLSRQFVLSGRSLAVFAGIALVAINLIACKSTFRDPPEWVDVHKAATAAKASSSNGDLVAGHSAVLFYADRRGFPMAYGPDEVKYQFGTFPSHSFNDPTVTVDGGRHSNDNASELLDFYHTQGARYFVELLGTVRELENPEFFADARRRYRVIAEQPGHYVVFDLESLIESNGAPLSN